MVFVVPSKSSYISSPGDNPYLSFYSKVFTNFLLLKRCKRCNEFCLVNHPFIHFSPFPMQQVTKSYLSNTRALCSIKTNYYRYFEKFLKNNCCQPCWIG